MLEKKSMITAEIDAGHCATFFMDFFFTIFDSIVKCMFYGQMNQHKKYLKYLKKGSKFTILASYVFFINQFNYQEKNTKRINDFMFHTRILKIFEKRKKKFILDENLKLNLLRQKKCLIRR